MLSKRNWPKLSTLSLCITLMIKGKTISMIKDANFSVNQRGISVSLVYVTIHIFLGHNLIGRYGYQILKNRYFKYEISCSPELQIM